MKKINEFSMKFLAKSNNESFARSIVGVFASQLDPTVDEISDLKTAVSEAVTNCVVHAYGTKAYENKENMIEQIVGVSELVAYFLYKLAENFECVYVNSVDGNHSRIDPNLENVLRNERYDSLIPWYCKAKLADIDNIVFVNNSIDSSIGSFEIYGLLYISVHGDLEKDLKVSAHNIEKMIGRHIDYMLAAHTHVPELRLEDTVYIRNGCVCGSGDDYTMKKRLFGPPSQVCMICSDRGIDSIHPVIL